MKPIFYFLSTAAMSVAFLGGYWIRGELLPEAATDPIMPVAAVNEKKAVPSSLKQPSDTASRTSNTAVSSQIRDRKQKIRIKELSASVRASGVPEEDVEMVAETLAGLNGTDPLPVSETTEAVSAPQTMEDLVASVRASGVPEEDIEAVASTLAGLTGIDTELTDQDELTASQQMEVAASVRASGVPEEDVEMIAETLGAAALSEDFPDEATNYEERIIEAADSAREAGVPEEDVEAVAEAIAGPELEDAVSDETKAEKIAEISAAVREAGVPEEDVRAVAETLAGAYPEFSTEEADPED